MNRILRVFLVESLLPGRRSIAPLLLLQADIALVGQVDHRRHYAERVQSASPDVLLVDTGLPADENVSIVTRIRDSHPILPVVVRLVEDTPESVVDHLQRGANACLCRATTVDEIVAVLQRIHRGENIYPPAIVPVLFQRLREGSADQGCPSARLSCRETEVLRLLASGLVNKQIAARLGITVCTVKNHVHKILGKLQVNHRRDAIQCAYQHGILGGRPADHSVLGRLRRRAAGDQPEGLATPLSHERCSS